MAGSRQLETIDHASLKLRDALVAEKSKRETGVRKDKLLIGGIDVTQLQSPRDYSYLGRSRFHCRLKALRLDVCMSMTHKRQVVSTCRSILTSRMVIKLAEPGGTVKSLRSLGLGTWIDMRRADRCALSASRTDLICAVYQHGQISKGTPDRDICSRASSDRAHTILNEIMPQ
ncbi:uncharacterized protein K489DRAFT_85493 [Dissoconium aciculare CBS 342.82]|uniref:Uncharacterized protein n=1 Tax=Dissoconium aciculare CBS 342.82 TaxID=1314786 RepID=A0A6J3LTN2_9PEZI|nr:uncharacterized protein K489DRAFT_85493 [Dissoconium aciculare CBS 342.82]KAF1818988.1 hypothetical protein K489DRAFT_85493 [Dissoconium aciculare CBS 342.82]